MTSEPSRSAGISRTIFKSTVMLTTADLMTRLTTLAITFMISRRLGVASLGIYATATATFSLIAIAGGLGATNYMVREIAKDPEDTGRFFSHISAMGLAVALVLMGGFWAVLPWLDYSRELETAMSIVVIALIPGTINTLMRAVFVAHQRVVFITYTTALAALLNIGISWWMLAGGRSIAYLLLAFVIEQYIVVLVGLAVIHLRIAPLQWQFNWGFAKSLLREIRTFALLSLLAAVFAQPEILILSAVASEVEVGYFGAAFRLVSFWMIVPAVLMTNVFPFMARAQAGSEQTIRLQHTSVKYLLLVSFPIAAGMAAAADPIIRLFYGEGYEPAVRPLQIMAAVLVFNSLDQVYWRALAARNEQRNDLLVRTVSASVRIAARMGPHLGIRSVGRRPFCGRQRCAGGRAPRVLRATRWHATARPRPELAGPHRGPHHGCCRLAGGGPHPVDRAGGVGSDGLRHRGAGGACALRGGPAAHSCAVSAQEGRRGQPDLSPRPGSPTS